MLRLKIYAALMLTAAACATDAPGAAGLPPEGALAAPAASQPPMAAATSSGAAAMSGSAGSPGQKASQASATPRSDTSAPSKTPGAATSTPGPDETPAQPAEQPEQSVTSDAGQAPTSMRCTDVVREASADPGTGYPGGRWKVPEPMYGTVIEQNIRVMMSDGVELVGDVSYPADLSTRQRASGEFPVILTQNPYGAGFGADYGSLFVTHGYIFASFDVRGTSRSAGTHDMFSPREAEDGAALVSWAAALSGSDGRVGLQGCSQLGINQLETATLLGPDSPVKAMIPACASGDFYRDTAFDNGIPTIVGSALAGDDASDGGDLAYYREYWKTRDRLARAPALARANIPTLLWSGWHEPGAFGSLELYVALQNLSAGRPANAQITADQAVNGRYQVILGDWAHAGGLDMGIELQWFDTWIKGIDTGLPTDTKTPLHLAELGGSKRWINSGCYPLVESYTPLYLGSGGTLGMAADSGESEQKLTWSQAATPAGAVEYVSEPMADGALLAGPIAAQLYVSSSNTNIQLHIEVLDRAPNGQSKRFTRGSILGTLRRTDAELSWKDQAGLPKRPRLTLDEDQPLMAAEPTLLEVPLWPTLWSLEPQHSLVVRISTQPASGDCLDPLGVPVGCYPTNPMLESLRGGSYTLQHGGQQASLISLPLVKHGAFPSATSAVSPTAAAAASSADAHPLPIDW